MKHKHLPFTPTISDQCSTRQDFSQQEFDDGQDNADQPTDDGHTEQEVVLKRKKNKVKF